jgi:hypothetical protein
MKYLFFFFLLLGFHSQAQITGNPHVKDSSALMLNSAAVQNILGKWKLLRTVEYLHHEEQSRDRGLIVAFDKKGSITTSWCPDCQEENAGRWEILHEQTIKFSGGTSQESRYLAGDYVVYTLTENELILAKVLTSSGDWRKFQYFSRNLGNPPITDLTSYCINCKADGAWCLGDKPDRAKLYWVIVNLDPEKEENPGEHARKVAEGYDWLLSNAPCIDKYLYVKAISFYENLLAEAKEEQTVKAYQEKIIQTKKQQQLYFKN